MAVVILAVLFVGAGTAAFMVTVNAAVDAGGSLEPARVWPVRSLESGVIAKTLVATGDSVRPGQLLVGLDSLTIIAELGELAAQREEATLLRDKMEATAPLEMGRQTEVRAQGEAHIVRARATLLARMTEYSLGANVDSLLLRYVVGTGVDMDLAVADLRVAESETRAGVAVERLAELQPYDVRKQRVEIERLEGAIAAKHAHLRRLEIRAPAAGVVFTEQIDRLVGESVRAGDLIVELADPTSWHATMFVSEHDIHQIRVGAKATVDIPALKHLNIGLLDGVVESMALEPPGSDLITVGGAQSINPIAASAGLYRVVVRINSQQLRMIGLEYFRKGYSVTGRIITHRGRIAALLRDYLLDRLPSSAQP